VNFLFWQTLDLLALHVAQVEGLLDGTDAAHAKLLDVEDTEKKNKIIPNPSYMTWIARDQAVLTYLLNSFPGDPHPRRWSSIRGGGVEGHHQVVRLPTPHTHQPSAGCPQQHEEERAFCSRVLRQDEEHLL
jgi:hypothetical protein